MWCALKVHSSGPWRSIFATTAWQQQRHQQQQQLVLGQRLISVIVWVEQQLIVGCYTCKRINLVFVLLFLWNHILKQCAMKMLSLRLWIAICVRWFAVHRKSSMQTQSRSFGADFVFSFFKFHFYCIRLQNMHIYCIHMFDLFLYCASSSNDMFVPIYCVGRVCRVCRVCRVYKIVLRTCIHFNILFEFFFYSHALTIDFISHYSRAHLYDWVLIFRLQFNG